METSTIGVLLIAFIEIIPSRLSVLYVLPLQSCVFFQNFLFEWVILFLSKKECRMKYSTTSLLIPGL